MSTLECSAKALEAIIYNGKTFQAGVKEQIAGENSEKSDRVYLSALTGCALRHLFLFEELMSHLEGEYQNKERMILFSVFSDYYFLKKTPFDELIKEVKELLGDKYRDEIATFLKENESLTDLIQQKYSPDSLDYIELRFNTPKWIVKMWQRQFGRSFTFKILKKNTRSKLITVRVNTLETTADEILEANPDAFEKTKVENILLYRDKKPLRKTSEFRKFLVLFEKVPLKVALDRTYQTNLRKVLVYSNNDDSLVRETYMRLKDEMKVEFLFDKIAERKETMKLIKHYHKKNVSSFELDENDELPAKLSHDFDLALIYPKSSSFDNIRLYPDFFLHFNREDLDKYIEKQRKLLNSISENLKEDGHILYMVDTIDKKEGHSLIMDFLNKHHDFELKEEKQYFPFDELDTAFYYASLQKVGESRSD